MAISKTTAGARASGSSMSREKPLTTIPYSVNFFSELEVNAIELLVQLSGSSCCNGGSTEEESESKSRAAPPHHDDDQVSSSFSKYETLVSEADEDEEMFEPRKRRFRSISELYELTEPLNLFIVAKETQGKRRKIMSTREEEEDNVKLIPLPSGLFL